MVNLKLNDPRIRNMQIIVMKNPVKTRKIAYTFPSSHYFKNLLGYLFIIQNIQLQRIFSRYILAAKCRFLNFSQVRKWQSICKRIYACD